MQWWHEKYKDWQRNDASYESRVDEYISDLNLSKKFETWEVDVNQLKMYIQDHRPSNYGDLSEMVYRCWAIGNKKAPQAIVDKNNYYIAHIPELFTVWPDASIIHLVRDGRDVACSYLAMRDLNSSSPYLPQLPTAIDEIAEDWLTNNVLIEKFHEGNAAVPYIRVRYEDLLTDTKDILKTICAFLELKYDSAMELYYQTNAEPSSTLDWKRKTLNRPDSSNIGKHKETLTNVEVSIFNEVAGNMLQHYRYL